MPGELSVVAESFTDFIAHFSSYLSSDGVLLDGAPPLERSSVVRVRFKLSDGFELVTAQGMVAGWKEGGLGVHFLDIESGAELLAKIEADHAAKGGTPFVVDDAPAAALPATAPAVAEPPPSEPTEPTEPTEPMEPDAEPEPLRGLLGEENQPAFAPGMDRLEGEGRQEHAALTDLGEAPQMRPAGLQGLGEGGEETGAEHDDEAQQAAESAFDGPGEAQRELEAAEEKMNEPPEPQAEVSPAAKGRDLAELSDDEFADEIDSVLDVAFGGGDESDPVVVPGEDQPSELAAADSTPDEPQLDADVLADLLHEPELEPENDLELQGDSEPEGVSSEVEADLGRSDATEAEPADFSTRLIDVEQLAEEGLLDPPLSAETDVSASEEALEAAPVEEALLEEANLGGPQDAELSDVPSTELQPEPPPSLDSDSLLDMPVLDDMATSSQAASAGTSHLRRGLIPLLLLALVGVGAWRVADLVRQEFSRLEEGSVPAARVALEDGVELLEAEADSLLAASQEGGEIEVSLAGGATDPPATLLENVTWNPTEDGTEIVLATNGLLSAADTSVIHLEGDRPRLVLKLGGMVEPYFANQLPLRTSQVRSLRFGYHLGTLRNEIHVVADLADGRVRLRSVDLSPGRLVLSLR